MTRWPFVERLYHLDTSQALLAGVASFVAVVVLDGLTGAQVTVTTLYLLPILIAGWNCGFAWGMAFVVMSVLAQDIMGLVHGHPYSQPVYFFITLANRFVTYTVALALIWRLRVFHERERRVARIDHLTGVMNRRGLHEALERELRRHARTRRPLCVAYFDCDDFKAVNDRGGHAEGDRLLQAIAGTLTRNVRTSDLVARVGGDEFAIVFPETDGESLAPAIAKARKALVSMCAHGGWPVTFSIGVVTFAAPPASADTVLATADETMYRAKTAGKDQVAFEPRTAAEAQASAAS
ncbi:MAG TPA: GGDEF domain-containing protein [Casimicrobiaceae bacterium]